MALLEGDDYWIEPEKLERQVDFLESNTGYVLSGHNCVTRDEWTGTEKIRCRWDNDMTLTTCHLIDFPIPTASMVFRNRLLGEWPQPLLASKSATGRSR